MPALSNLSIHIWLPMGKFNRREVLYWGTLVTGLWCRLPVRPCHPMKHFTSAALITILAALICTRADQGQVAVPAQSKSPPSGEIVAPGDEIIDDYSRSFTGLSYRNGKVGQTSS